MDQNHKQVSYKWVVSKFLYVNFSLMVSILYNMDKKKMCYFGTFFFYFMNVLFWYFINHKDAQNIFGVILINFLYHFQISYWYD